MRTLKNMSIFHNFIMNKSFYFLSKSQNYSRYYCNLITFSKNIQLHCGNHKITAIPPNSFNFWIPSYRKLSLSNVFYAVTKFKDGKKKKQDTSKVDLRELSELIDTENLTEEMNQVIENMKTDFIRNLSLRSASGALDELPIKVDDKQYTLQELAQISRKPKLIVLNLAAFPTTIPEVIKAIQSSGLNINPQQDGTTLFLPIPKVTKEHREKLSKNAKSLFIKYRDQIKDVRNKYIKTLKKHTDVSQDVIRRVQAQLEILCNNYVKNAEVILETKQNELLKSGD